MNLIAAWPRLMSPEIATEYVGSKMILDALLKEKLLKPKVQRAKGLTLYDRFVVDAALDTWKGFGPV